MRLAGAVMKEGLFLPIKRSRGLHSTAVQFIIVAASAFFAEVIMVALQDVAEDFVVLGDEQIISVFHVGADFAGQSRRLG